MADEALAVVISDEPDDVHVDPATGDINVPSEDGGVVVHLNAARNQADEDAEDPFYANLAGKIDPTELGVIANDLHDAISADDASRKDSLSLYERALDLLGIKLSEPKAAVGDSSAAAEGLSTVTNPLMLEAVLKGWANAEAELLPASGPVKIQVDGDETPDVDELAETYERHFNHYLTRTAVEYYPDTSHMLLWGTHLRGSGFKKVYRCPLRRRPVSESVDAKNLIVSDTMKDLRSCARVTHEIPMRPSVMKRMIRAGAYRDIAMTQPTGQSSSEGVDQAIGAIQGTSKPSRPEDQPYTLWESQCELDLPRFAPKDFKDTGIPLPYIVTMDKESRDILAIRRDWAEDDKDGKRQRMYVRYPYIPGPGFYGTGLLNVLGNCSMAMTAAWRISLDASMLSIFPGGVIAKDAVRGQNSALLKGGPTEFVPVETGGKPIAQTVMAWPYKDVSPGLLALMDKIKAQADAAGAAAEIPVGEGLQNVPVGTMLAAVEQATKVMAAAFKGMHVAQSEEIELFVELFREHPDDFTRECPDPDYWDEQKLLTAIEDNRLVPVSDPNVPSHIHRVMKAVALVQLTTNPVLGPRLDPDEVLKRTLRAMREDPRGLILPPPQPGAAPDPQALTAAAKLQTAQAQSTKAQADASVAQQKAAQEPQDTQLEAAKLQTQRDIAASNVEKEKIIHQGDMAKAAHAADIDRGDQAIKAVKVAHDISKDQHQRGMDVAQHGLAVGQAQHEASLGNAQHALDVHQALNPPQPIPPKKGE